MFGKKQIESAATDKIDKLLPEANQLLLSIAQYMIAPGESAKDWVDSTFVSDKSSIFDFLMEEDVEPLRADLGLLTLSGRDLICDVAQTMRNMKMRH